MTFKKFAPSFFFLTLSLLSGFEPSCFYDYGYPPPLETDSDLGDLFVDAEWLFLKPAVDHLSFCEKGILPTPSATVSPITTHRVAPSLKWDSGVRLFAGYSLPLDQWALKASYIFYRTDASRQIESLHTSDPNGKNSYLIPTLAETFIDIESAGKFHSKGHWKWNLNLFDIDLSRISFLNRAVSLSPNVGFRYIWSQQNLHSQFFSRPKNPDFGFILHDKNENHFKGFGVKFGLDSVWDLGVCGFSFFANGDWSLLTGTLAMNQAFTPADVETGLKFAIPVKSHDHSRSMKQMFHGAFGVQWMTSFDCDSIHLLVKGGWEQFFFPNFNQLTRRVIVSESMEPLTIPVSVEGDMGLYGVSLGATLIF